MKEVVLQYIDGRGCDREPRIIGVYPSVNHAEAVANFLINMTLERERNYFVEEYIVPFNEWEYGVRDRDTEARETYKVLGYASS